MTRDLTRNAMLSFLLVALLPCLLSGAPTSTPEESSEIDAFMEKVLIRREINWAELESYLFSERELVEVKGSDGTVYEREEGEYTRFVEEGFLVRSPIKVDGVEVSAEDRRKFELDWLADRKRDKEREEAKKADESATGDDDGEPGVTNEAKDPGLERETFLGFQFEPGNYYFVGPETFEGKTVVKVEYYPKKLFDDADDDEDADGFEIGAKLSKTTLVTMLILPETHQLVKLTFDNVGLDFMPMRWLVRFEGLAATMVMDEPIPGVWLPREIDANGSLTSALGSVEMRYHREFYDYREADVGIQIDFGAPAGE